MRGILRIGMIQTRNIYQFKKGDILSLFRVVQEGECVLASRFVPLVVASLIHGFDWIFPNDMDPAHIHRNEILVITMFKNGPLDLVIPKLRKKVREFFIFFG